MRAEDSRVKMLVSMAKAGTAEQQGRSHLMLLGLKIGVMIMAHMLLWSAPLLTMVVVERPTSCLSNAVPTELCFWKAFSFTNRHQFTLCHMFRVLIFGSAYNELAITGNIQPTTSLLAWR